MAYIQSIAYIDWSWTVSDQSMEDGSLSTFMDGILSVLLNTGWGVSAETSVLRVHVYLSLNYINIYIGMFDKELLLPIAVERTVLQMGVILLLDVSLHCFSFQMKIPGIQCLIINVIAITLPTDVFVLDLVCEYWTEFVAMELPCLMFTFPTMIFCRSDWGHVTGCHYGLPWIDHLPPFMMTSSNGNIFRATGHLCGEFTGPRWLPYTKASDAELWCFLWSASE